MEVPKTTLELNFSNGNDVRLNVAEVYNLLLQMAEEAEAEFPNSVAKRDHALRVKFCAWFEGFAGFEIEFDEAEFIERAVYLTYEEKHKKKLPPLPMSHFTTESIPNSSQTTASKPLETTSQDYELTTSCSFEQAEANSRQAESSDSSETPRET